VWGVGIISRYGFLSGLNREIRELTMGNTHTGHFADTAFPAAVLVQNLLNNGNDLTVYFLAKDVIPVLAQR